MQNDTINIEIKTQDSLTADLYSEGDSTAAIPPQPPLFVSEKIMVIEEKPILAQQHLQTFQERLRDYLKTRNLRMTPERLQVLEGVLSREGLFDAEDLLKYLQKQGKTVSRATLYRTLEHLADAGPADFFTGDIAAEIERDAKALNPMIKVFPVSATTGEGLDRWYDWLRKL